jgi:hypothetical protein
VNLRFSPARFLVFTFIGLPLGFILTALGFAIAELPIIARDVFPWALGCALVVGAAGGCWKQTK